MKPSPAPAQGRVLYLDGIRAIAILAVLAVHLIHPYSALFFGGRTDLFFGGGVGVDLFFVLSGYIITRILWQKREITFGSFVTGRFRRLFPALFGMVLLATPAVVLLNVVPLEQALRAALFALGQANSIVSGFFPTVSPDPFGPTWTLSVEWIFYLIWAIVVLRAKAGGLSPRKLALIAGISAVVLYAVSVPATLHYFYFGPTSRGSQLLIGACLALLTTTWQPRALAKRWIGLLAPLCLIVIIGWITFGPTGETDLYRNLGFPLITVSAGVLVISGLIAPTAFTVRILSMRWLAAIGRVSYSLYLWHTIPLILTRNWESEMPIPLLIAGRLLVAIVFTLLSYRFLEKPFMKSGASALSRPQETAGAASVHAGG